MFYCHTMSQNQMMGVMITVNAVIISTKDKEASGRAAAARAVLRLREYLVMAVMVLEGCVRTGHGQKQHGSNRCPGPEAAHGIHPTTHPFSPALLFTLTIIAQTIFTYLHMKSHIRGILTGSKGFFYKGTTHLHQQ